MAATLKTACTHAAAAVQSTSVQVQDISPRWSDSCFRARLGANGLGLSLGAERARPQSFLKDALTRTAGRPAGRPVFDQAPAPGRWLAVDLRMGGIRGMHAALRCHSVSAKSSSEPLHPLESCWTATSPTKTTTNPSFSTHTDARTQIGAAASSPTNTPLAHPRFVWTWPSSAENSSALRLRASATP